MSEHKCSVTEHLEIVPAGLAEYEQLSAFHYRAGRLCPHAAIYAVKDTHFLRGRFETPVGVIVYTMPVPSLELRNVATAGRFAGFSDRRLALQRVNENIRCISRVIIEPRYRGLGLASWLVKETMPGLGAAVIEAMAVMGRVSSFFERAGMRSFTAPVPARCEKLTAALGMVGIDESLLIDARGVQQRLEGLASGEADFIEGQIRSFLQAYGKRKDMAPGIERTRYILSRLTVRPVYYIWIDPKANQQEAKG